MSNENIVTIVGFVICIVVSVLAIITMILSIFLLVKRTARISGLNNNVYNTEQMKELLNKYCATDAIKTKGILEHPSTVQPKWLTHLYVDNVENDGEFPYKKNLHDLLDYMVDYVGSWTRCDDEYSAQQMKDMLPLLVRCKNILEKKGE